MNMEQILEKIEDNKEEIKNMSFGNMSFYEIEKEIEKQRQENKDKPLYECDEFKITYFKQFPDFSEHILTIKHLTGEEIPLILPGGTLFDFVNTEKNELGDKITKYENDYSSLEEIKSLLKFQKVTMDKFHDAVVEAYIEDERRSALAMKYREFHDCPYF